MDEKQCGDVCLSVQTAYHNSSEKCEMIHPAQWTLKSISENFVTRLLTV